MNYGKTMLLLASLTALFMGVGWLIGGGAGMLIALVIAIGTNFYAYWNSDEMALRAHNARPVTRASAPEIYAMVEDLAKRADLPTPAVYVIDTDQPNAFATGRSPEKAAVAATRGIIQTLSREELAGVMAHELAHIKNRDTLIMTVAATVAGAISMLAQFGMFFGGGRDRGALGIVGVIVAAILAPIAAMMIQGLISRTREYSADKAGGEICGNPLWLASALAKISRSPALMQTAEDNPASAHLFIVNPLSGMRMDRLFSTHPPAERRIAELKAQAAAMGRMSRPSGDGAKGTPWGGNTRRSPWQ
ncbi:zinc metalloprotease HtpX [Rhodobacteraceae bacterium NNCM2]|nr:zinc metalloprotease HtpX [Coraliihabitans acroporae]